MNVNQINDASILFNTTTTTQSNIPNDTQRSLTGQLIVAIIVSQLSHLFQRTFFCLSCLSGLSNHHPLKYHWKCHCSDCHLTSTTITTSDQFHSHVFSHC